MPVQSHALCYHTIISNEYIYRLPEFLIKRFAFTLVIKDKRVFEKEFENKNIKGLTIIESSTVFP